jgi:hypothetical protein
MVLNKTNANNIALAYGEETDDWRDQEIILFEAMVDFQGKTVPAIRVKGPVKNRQAPARQMATAENDRDPQPPMRQQASTQARPDLDDEIPF